MNKFWKKLKKDKGLQALSKLGNNIVIEKTEINFTNKVDEKGYPVEGSILISFSKQEKII